MDTTYNSRFLVIRIDPLMGTGKKVNCSILHPITVYVHPLFRWKTYLWL